MTAMVDLLLAHGLTLGLGLPEAAAASGGQPPQQGLPDVTPLSPPVHSLTLFKVPIPLFIICTGHAL